MKLSSDRILTTHAGSLPRPDDLQQMLFDVIDEKQVDEAAFEERVREAINEVVPAPARHRDGHRQRQRAREGRVLQLRPAADVGVREQLSSWPWITPTRREGGIGQRGMAEAGR